MNRPIYQAETRASDLPLKNRYQLSNQVDSRFVQLSPCQTQVKVENKITDNQLMAIELAINRSDNAISLATELNQYGHNYEIDPLPEWLSSCFNNLRPLLENMYR